MRRWGRIAIACFGIALAPLYACLLDIPDVVNGDASITDGMAPDGGASGDVNVPETCATLDASCVSVPTDWQPVLVIDGGECASGFAAAAFVTNAQLAVGACACPKCTTSGAYSCDASVQVLTNGSSCTSSTKIQAGQCANLSANGYAEYFGYTAVGTAACDAGAPTNTNVTTDSLIACFPSSCTADFCNAGGAKCITRPDVYGCPAAFPNFTVVANSAAANCTPCGCMLNNATCMGTLHVYSQVNCASQLANVLADNTCTDIQGTAASVEFVAGFLPPPSCTEQQDASTVTLDQPRTICCAP